MTERAATLAASHLPQQILPPVLAYRLVLPRPLPHNALLSVHMVLLGITGPDP